MTLRWAFLLTALGAGANTCSIQTALAQEPQVVTVSTDTILTLGQLANMDGVTFCVGRQVYTRMDPTLDSIPFRAIEAHEAKHREQFSRFPSCKAWDADYRTPLGKLNSEAEAYAAGWCEAKRLGYGDMEQLERNSIQSIYRLLGGGTPIFTILQSFKHYVDGCS